MKNESVFTSKYLLALVVVVLVVAAGTWYLTGPGVLKPPIDGILCQAQEGSALHFHVQVQLFREGRPVMVPAGIGVSNGCYYWVHTHTADGVIHIESPVVREFTLGQFFDIWGQQPGAGIKVFAKKEGEKEFQEILGDWKSLILSPHQIIALGTGNFLPQPFNFPAGL